MHLRLGFQLIQNSTLATYVDNLRVFIIGLQICICVCKCCIETSVCLSSDYFGHGSIPLIPTTHCKYFKKIPTPYLFNASQTLGYAKIFALICIHT